MAGVFEMLALKIEESLDAVENNARLKLLNKLGITKKSDDDLFERYYGDQLQRAEDFEIPIGHRMLILKTLPTLVLEFEK